MTVLPAQSSDFSFSNLRSLLHPERVLMTKYMVAGMGLGTLSFAALWQGLPAIEAQMDLQARAVQVLGMASAVGGLLFASVCSCFRLFDTEHAMNPLAHAESRRYQVSNRVLSNTVEQALIFLPPFFALGFLLEGADFRVLPALLGTWIISRIVFFAGYQFSAPARGLGMVPTLMASAALYALLASKLWA